MDKPYDLKDLGARVVAKAKEQGLTLAEDTVENLIESVFEASEEWLRESVDLSPTPIDNLLVSVVTYFKKQIQEQIAKIDLDGDGD